MPATGAANQALLAGAASHSTQEKAKTQRRQEKVDIW